MRWTPIRHSGASPSGETHFTPRWRGRRASWRTPGSWRTRRPMWLTLSVPSSRAIRLSWKSSPDLDLRRRRAVPPLARAPRVALRPGSDSPAGHGARDAAAQVRLDPRRGDEREVVGDGDDL